MKFIGDKRLNKVVRLANKHELKADKAAIAGGYATVGGAAAMLFTSSSIPEIICVGGLLLLGAARGMKALAKTKCEHNRRLADCEKCKRQAEIA